MRHLFAPLVTVAALSLPLTSHAEVVAPSAGSSPGAAVSQSTEATTARDARARDEARYGEKEQSPGAEKAEQFRGGDTVVIGASAATAILAVLLLIVLI